MIKQYKKIQTEFTTIMMSLPMVGFDEMFDPSVPKCTELVTIDGITYVNVPEGVTLPEQHIKLSITDTVITDELILMLKEKSHPYKFINETAIRKIRERYSLDDEAYLNRISNGHLLGIYTLEAGEMDKIVAYGTYVEDVRKWARIEKTKIGLD